MTLALLLTAVTGAWAEEKSETISTTTTQMEYTGEHFKITTNDLYDGLAVADLRCYDDGQRYISVETLDGQNISKLDLQISFISDTSIDNLSLSSGTKSYDSNTKVLTITNVNADHVQITLTEGDQCGIVTISSVTCYYEESPSGPEVAWNAATKTGTFVMPAFDVEIDPIYAPVAQWAKVENVDQLPTAIEGIYAESTDAIVKAGTVAKIGETENLQGTLMYAVGTSATEQPALTAFSATLPTAEKIAAGDVYVWYYIKGADTPQGQTATADNTFNDSEICATPIKVTVLNNKFDIQFKAANANTIEAGKATFTVGGTAATVTEGKLEGVKMGSEVKVKANTGYKFRKVEVKKKAAEPVADIVWDVTNVTDIAVQGDFLTYEKEGVTLSGNADNMEVNWVDFGDPTTDGISFIANESGGFTFTAPAGKAFTKIEMKALGSYGWAQENLGTGWAYFGDDKNKIYKVTWTGSAASTVKLLTGTDNFFGDYISSIAFYLSE